MNKSEIISINHQNMVDARYSGKLQKWFFRPMYSFRLEEEKIFESALPEFVTEKNQSPDQRKWVVRLIHKIKDYISLMFTLLLLFVSSSVFAQQDSDVLDCPCAEVKQETQTWCEGSRGGTYCFYFTKKGERTKYYKMVIDPNCTKENPCIGPRGGKYYFKKNSKGHWVKVYLE